MIRALLLAIALLFLAAPAFAQDKPPAAGDKPAAAAPADTGPKEFALSKPLVALIAIGALSLAPFILTMTTSFLKFSVIGSILRSALGTQQIPPNQVLMGLSLILTVYVMSPVGMKIYNEISGLMNEASDKGVMSDKGIEIIREAIDKGKKPYLEFLSRHAHAKDKELFVSMAKTLRRDDPDAQEKIDPNHPMVLIPAFVTSELTEAFAIAFLVFLPFLVLDLVVGIGLGALGLTSTPPSTVALPLKLVLFVAVDGWRLLVDGLARGYT